MRDHGRVIFGGLSTFFILAAAQISIAHAETEVGRIALANGDVRITKSETDNGRAAKPNDLLYNTDIVKTGANASAKMLFTDQSVMDVGPGSALKVSDYALKDGDSRTGTFSLLYGKMRALVTKKVGDGGKVEVKSGDTVMGVRGTEFVVDKAPGNSGATQLVVVTGLVQVRPPGGGAAVPVGAGQVMVAQKSSSPSSSTNSGQTGAAAKSDKAGESGGNGVTVRDASPEQVQAALKTSKTEDNTFNSVVKIEAGPGGGSSSTSAEVGNLVSNSIGVPPPRSDSGDALPPPRTVAVPNFLPPVSIIPGNRVHLTVGIQ